MKTQIFAVGMCVVLLGVLLQRPAPQPPATVSTQMTSQLASIQADLADLIEKAATAAEMRDQNNQLAQVLANLADNQLDMATNQQHLADSLTAVISRPIASSVPDMSTLVQIDTPKAAKSVPMTRFVSEIETTAKTQAKVKEAMDSYGADPDLVARVTALEADLAALKSACQNCNCIVNNGLQAKVTSGGGSNGSVSYSPYTTTTTSYAPRSSGGSTGTVSYSPYVQTVQAVATVPQNVRIVQPRTVTRAVVNQPVPVNMSVSMPMYDQYDPGIATSNCVQQADGSYDCSGNSVSVPTVQTQSRARIFPRLFGR